MDNDKICDILSEAAFLLRTNSPEECLRWIGGIGDCGKPDCPFCRVLKCIEDLDEAWQCLKNNK